MPGSGHAFNAFALGKSVYGKLVKADALRLAYGWLPYMALSSRGQLSTLLAKSFCERIMSKGNLVMTDGNTLLSDQELEIVVVLRMNMNSCDT